MSLTNKPEWVVRNRLHLYRPVLFDTMTPTSRRGAETWVILIEQRTSGPQRGKCRVQATLEGIGAVCGFSEGLSLVEARKRAAILGATLAGFIRDGNLVIQGLDLDRNPFDMGGEDDLLRVLRRQRGKVLHAE